MDKYSESVVNRKRKVSKEVEITCLRMEFDYARQLLGDESFEYYYDESSANKAVEFINGLTDYMMLKKIKLMDFQEFIVKSIFGWKVKGTDELRFERVFFNAARKNGATFLLARILIYAQTLKSERVISFGYDLKQGSNLCHVVKMIVLINDLDKMVFKNIDIKSVRSRSADGYKIDTKVYTSIALDDVNIPYENIYCFMTGEKDFEFKSDDRTFNFICKQDSENEIKNKDMWVKSNPLLDNEETSERFYSFIEKQLEDDTRLYDFKKARLFCI